MVNGVQSKPSGAVVHHFRDLSALERAFAWLQAESDSRRAAATTSPAFLLVADLAVVQRLVYGEICLLSRESNAPETETELRAAWGDR